jgi:hypothetical protein
MFNGDLKKAALNRLEKSNEKYQKTADLVGKKASNLHSLRISTSKKVISKAEEYINTLASAPKEFEKSVADLSISFERFERICREVMDQDNVAAVGGSTAGAGVAAGVGVAAFGPTAAIWAATTFGTASTGTAISALSGAAATNAALAWLGGGALAVGGGGMAAGNTLLAMAGPVGWAIGGATLVGSGLWARNKNKEIAEEATQEALRIEKCKRALDSAHVEIDEITNLTKKHSEGAYKHLYNLSGNAPANYSDFSDQEKQDIGALINNINSLSKLLQRKVGADGKR